MIEVSVADEHGAEPRLVLDLHAARERARVDREHVVDEERARSMARGLAAVTADDAELHAAYASPPNFCGISRNSRKS